MPSSPKIRIDSEFSHLIQHPSTEGYRQLERDLLRDKGARDPLVLWGSILLDGHARYEICRKHGLPFKTVQKPCTSRNAARFFIIRTQLGRRNLQPYTRVELALALEPELIAQAKARQRARGPLRGSQRFECPYGYTPELLDPPQAALACGRIRQPPQGLSTHADNYHALEIPV